MTHVTCRLTAKNQDQLRKPTLGNQVWATFTFFLFCSYSNATAADQTETERWTDTTQMLWIHS